MTTHNELSALLKRHFGFEQFRAGQIEVIDNLLAGRSAAAIFPTGGGKSLCYQLPALVLPGVTLVVSPLIALMKDQIDALERCGIPARRLDSSLSPEAYRAVMTDIRSGALRLLYVSPERFNNERFRETVIRLQVSLFAVDEAHCISEWGHNFRPDYLKLAEFARHCGAERVLALTATATRPVLDDICRALDIAPDCATRTGFFRPNLSLLSEPATDTGRDGALIDAIRKRPAGAAIVYVTLQKTAEDVAAVLTESGWDARAYHAGMSSEKRAVIQEWFTASRDGIVAATIAFGMGVDKPDIRYVYHYNMPKSLENYAQEIGRSGRDGADSICHMFVCPDDVLTLENFVYGDTPSQTAILGLLNDIFSQPESFDVSYHELSARHDIRVLVVRTLMTYLELDQWLQGGTPFYSGFRFRPILSSAEILNRFSGDRRDFLAGVFRQAKKAKIWFALDIEQAARATASTRERVVRALDYLADQNLLEVKVQGVRHRYRRRRAADDLDALADDLYGRTRMREEREIARLNAVLAFAASGTCRMAALCAHFDSPITTDCGHCSGCMGDAFEVYVERPRPELAQDMIDKAVSLRFSFGDALYDRHSVARFLCGLTTPKLSRSKLTSHSLFGIFSHIPFDHVLAGVPAH